MSDSAQTQNLFLNTHFNHNQVVKIRVSNDNIMGLADKFSALVFPFVGTQYVLKL